MGVKALQFGILRLPGALGASGIEATVYEAGAGFQGQALGHVQVPRMACPLEYGRQKAQVCRDGHATSASVQAPAARDTEACSTAVPVETVALPFIARDPPATT